MTTITAKDSTPWSPRRVATCKAGVWYAGAKWNACSITKQRAEQLVSDHVEIDKDVRAKIEQVEVTFKNAIRKKA